jgi:hypothetical protein
MADGQVEVTAAVEVAMMGDVVRNVAAEAKAGSGPNGVFGGLIELNFQLNFSFNKCSKLVRES